MEQENRLYPALANDDAHAVEADQRDTYQGWTWVRVKEKTAAAVCEALAQGASYCSTGPEVRDIGVERNDAGVVLATVQCSEAQRVAAVHDAYGTVASTTPASTDL